MLTLKTADVVTGFAIAKPNSWFENGEVDCYRQSVMEDIDPIDAADYVNQSDGRFELAEDLIGSIQGISGTPYRYFPDYDGEENAEIHVLRLGKFA